MSGWTIERTVYPAVRRVMGPERESLEDAELEGLLAELFPGAAPEDVENFMRAVQRFGRQVAPIAQRALPGVIQGAATGASVGGPWGALIGAVGGGTAAALGGGGGPAPGARPVPPAARPPVARAPVAPVFAAAPGLGGVPAGVAQPAAPFPAFDPVAVPFSPAMAQPGGVPTAGANAGQLLALLTRPETVQALLALLMQGAGRTTIGVGTQAVPAPAFANAVAEIAAAAADAQPAPYDDGIAEFLLDGQGRARCDIANPAERAQLLLRDLAEVSWREAMDARAEAEEEEDEGEVADPWSDVEAIDPLDAYDEALGRHHVG